jgi:hypothetical protein
MLIHAHQHCLFCWPFAVLQAEAVHGFAHCITALGREAHACYSALLASAGSQPQQDASGAEQPTPEAALLDELRAPLSRLERMCERVLADGPDQRERWSMPKRHADKAAQLRHLLPPAAEVAALLQRYFELPEQEAARALQLARAAGGRSCAYLCCANLTMEGREAEGKLTQKCGQCRSVRYCSRACSVADWRAGHKRVCKALAAARDAES